MPISASDFSNFTIACCNAKDQDQLFVRVCKGVSMTSGDLDLVARDVSVQFEGLKALSGVTLAVTRGGITGLIGPNGAGKTTLVNVLTGFQRVGAGTVELEGEAVNGIPAHTLRPTPSHPTFQPGPPFL